MDDTTNEFLIDEYKKSRAIKMVNDAMKILDGVYNLMELHDADNDLTYGLGNACIDLDQIVLTQLEDGITKGKWS